MDDLNAIQWFTTTGARCDLLFTQAEMAAAGIPAGVSITAIQFNKTNVANFVTPAIYSILIGNTVNTALATTQTLGSYKWCIYTGIYKQFLQYPFSCGYVNMPIMLFINPGSSFHIAFYTLSIERHIIINF